MQITRLVLKELRAVAQMELDFSIGPGVPRKRTIILGVNGAGKTTILDAIIHSFVALTERSDLGANRLGGSDVRNVDDPAIATRRILRRGTVAIDFLLSDDEQRVVHRANKNAPANGTMHFAVGNETEDVDDNEEWDDNPDGEVSFHDVVRLVLAEHTHPACAYLPACRGILEPNDEVRLKDVTKFDPFRNSLSRARERSAPIAARLALCGTPARTELERAVVRMWKVIEKYFPEMPKPLEPEEGMLRFRNHRGAIVPLTSLSDGERAILLIFADLALRNPQNNVVLIDELEQHLHPRWQRQMLYGLSSLLPNAQFIITTQSPYLAACAPDDVIKLPEWDTHGE